MEVLLVVAILVILASLATVAIRTAMLNAQTNSAKLNATTIKQAVNAYYLQIGTYPSSLNDLVVPPEGLADPSRWQAPFLEGGVLPVDPWQQQFGYEFDNQTGQFRISSAGPDGAPGTNDDIMVDG